MPKFIEGPAGAGKTRRLIELVTETMAVTPLAAHGAVLGLTFMHGSRRRMHARISTIIKARSGFYCTTFDSFAQSILERWSPLARSVRSERIPEALDFNRTCLFAAELMERNEVCSWIAARFPLVIVDEAQDLDENRLRMLQALSQNATLLAAADEFQDLNGTCPNDAVTWLRANSDIETLSTIHRTKCQALLEASLATREGRMPQTGKGFAIECVPTANLAAWHVALAIRKAADDTVAVLSPSNAPFTKAVLERVAESPIGKKFRIGPYSVFWEKRDDEEAEDLLQQLSLPNEFSIEQLLGALRAGSIYHEQVASWVRKLMLYGGIRMLTIEMVSEKIKELVHSRRSFNSCDERKIAAMTIHQSKNREFGCVVLLWPLLGSRWTMVQQRRLLYSGITRAKRSCVIVAHEPKNARRLEMMFK